MFTARSPGETLRGRYRIREHIGQGGAGNIYLAEDLRLQGRLCALKEVEHEPANNFSARPVFWRAWITPTCPKFPTFSAPKTANTW